MTPHLQPRFFSMGSFQVHGVDNGPFTSLSIPEDVLDASKEATPKPEEGILSLRKWKLERRRSFCSALHDLLEESKDSSKSQLGTKFWGDLQAFLLEQDKIQLALDDHAPWFVMGGRDDSRQKGYDVAAYAIRELLEEGMDAHFLFFPIPGDEGLGGLRFLADLSWDFPDRVLVFPFVFRAGYMAALQGATYALMPSFYEPFGAANEFYLSGTVGIGRATGGLVQQVIPLRQAPIAHWEYSHAVAWRSERWHGENALPTGLLYREPDGYHAAAEDWRGINDASYRTDGNPPNRMQQRQSFGTWRQMAAALKGAMLQAASLYQDAPLAYDTLLLNGVRHISNSFSWQRAAEEYLQCVAPHSLR